MSREQREKLQGTSSNDFWWMSKNSEEVHPSDISVPVESDSGGYIPETISALIKDNLDRNSLLEDEKVQLCSVSIMSLHFGLVQEFSFHNYSSIKMFVYPSFHQSN